MSEAGPRQRNALWFVAGLLVASVIWYFIATSGLRKLSQINDSTIKSQQQTIAQLQSTNAQLQATIQSSTPTLQDVTLQLNECNAKFARGTFIYEGGLLGETRAWYIPADIDPVSLTAKRGSYTHFDPKTQTETIHMPPKTP